MTFLLYLPAFAPQTPANLWCLLYFSIITSELTHGSGMIQPGTAFPEAGARAGLLDWQHRHWGGWPWVLSLSCKIVLHFQQKGFGGMWFLELEMG